jgi:trk system potassium uptake protein TrkA
MWGVDVAVSTPHLITGLVEEAVSVGSFVRLMSFGRGKARLAEVTLADGSPAADKEIVELKFPRDATVVAILRHDKVVVPRGDTVLRVGDEVIVLVAGDSEPDVRAVLIGA